MNENKPPNNKNAKALSSTKPSLEFVNAGTDRQWLQNDVNKTVHSKGHKPKYPRLDSASKKTPSIDYEHRKWLNSEEAAEYLGTTVGNIRNLRWKGKIPAHKPFGKLLFDRAQLDRLVVNAQIW